MDNGFINALRKVVGEDGLRLTNAQKHVYSSDAYTLEKALPGVVVLPRTTEEVSAVVRLCNKHKIPIVPRGAGTGLAGGSLAHDNEVLLCVSRLSDFLACRLIFGALLVMDILCPLILPTAFQIRNPGGPNPDWIYIAAMNFVMIGLVIIVNLRYSLSPLQRIASIASAIVALLSLTLIYAAWEYYRTFLQLLRYGA